MRDLEKIELLLGKDGLKKWILERWKCFGSFNKENVECILYCEEINIRCKKETN